ncbi:hypothetical protein Ahy_A09g042075 [Arachis hypogaea]|uniref:Aminotransferase-like plant mobile domain-containing protein n=1 Tax=Arachis hypogaea TaxID=3818 RepID=A0A445BEN8_ARAHY|nr:hypothetical protein Ahy_A09g042075 [Arachis hypogaea]
MWFEELLGVLPPANSIDKFTVKYTWFQETFSELPQGAPEETVWRYTLAYIMILLSTQLFGDKSGHGSVQLGVSCTVMAIQVHVPYGEHKCHQVSWSIAAPPVVDLLEVPWIPAG